MQEHFLREIEIIDYKCFKDFKAKGLERINLISGKNNVGKTAFMESLFINLHHKEISDLTFALDQITFSRDNLEYIENSALVNDVKKRIENINNYKTKSNNNIIEFKQIDNNGVKEYEFIINNTITRVNINDFSYSRTMPKNILHIDNFGLTNDNLIYIFEAIQKNDKETELNELISEFDSNITSFKIIGNTPQCKITNIDTYQKINEFGDGLKHYISIICDQEALPLLSC